MRFRAMQSPTPFRSLMLPDEDQRVINWLQSFEGKMYTPSSKDVPISAVRMHRGNNHPFEILKRNLKSGSVGAGARAFLLRCGVLVFGKLQRAQS